MTHLKYKWQLGIISHLWKVHPFSPPFLPPACDPLCLAFDLPLQAALTPRVSLFLSYVTEEKSLSELFSKYRKEDEATILGSLSLPKILLQDPSWYVLTSRHEGRVAE